MIECGGAVASAPPTPRQAACWVIRRLSNAPLFLLFCLTLLFGSSKVYVRLSCASLTMLDKIVGLAMLVAASVVFTYYTIWTLLMPFVDDDHPLQNFFPPRVWAIRIPVIIILLGSAVVGSFLGMVMIRSNQKKAAKAKVAAKKAN
ncbi:unnamed protein product [Fusarium langsethiae]|nr:unnamed protein product [Fusarium langsethiae]